MKWRLFAVAVALAVSATAVRSVGHGQPVPVSRPFWQFPNRVAEWQGEDQRMTAAIEKKVGVTDYISKTYRSDGERRAGLHFYVGFYESQRHGEMIHSPKNCLPGNGWFIEHRDTMTLDLPPYQPFEVNKFVIANGIDRQVVLYWYQQAGGRVVTNEYMGRVHMVMDALTVNRTDAALIRVIVPTPDNSEEATDASTRQAVAFLRSAYPELMQFLPHDRPKRPA